MALLGTLTDPFLGPTLNTALWTAVNVASNSGSQGGGRYTFIAKAAATSDAGLVSVANYNLTGSHAHVELIDAGSQQAGMETYALILSQATGNLTNSLYINIVNTTVNFRKVVAGVTTTIATATYNATTMRWWRIRESGGTVYYETAPEVNGTWTTRASAAPGITITALYARIRLNITSSLATAKQAAYSNINYVPAPAIAFPNGALETGLEFAFGADLTADQDTWIWTDVTPVTGTSVFMDQTVVTTRGRADESSDVTPSSADMELDNPAGDFTPDNPMSIYYPDVDLGTPARWWIEAPTPRLYLPANSSRALAATTTAMNLTSDLDVRVDMQMKTTDPGGWNAVVASRANTFAAYSWRVEIEPDRTVRLLWSTTGVTPALDALSTVPVIPMSARATLRVTLDVNNGASGWTARFYVGYAGVNGAFTQMGPDVTGSGTTSIFNVAEPITLGHPSEIAEKYSLDADIYAFQLRQGIGGTAIVDADFTAQASDVTGFVDSTGRSWVVSAPGALTNRWYRAYGTVDEWNPIWPWGDLSSQQDGGLGAGEARTQITIAGILRRLGAGTRPLESPLRRAIGFESTIVAYWPMEDEDDSTQIASGLPDGTPMSIGGVWDFAANDDVPGSKPLPTLTATSSFFGAVVGTFTNQFETDFYAYIPSTSTAAVFLMNVTTSGTVLTWKIGTTGGNVAVEGYSTLGALVVNQLIVGTDLFDRWVRFRFAAQQSGGNIAWSIAWYPVIYPVPASGSFSSTVVGTIGSPTAVYMQADADAVGISVGHVEVFNAFELTSFTNAAMGWIGDTAVERIIRLCDEEDINLRIIGNADTSAKMGIQQIASLITLLDDAKDADGGILYERPDAIGLIIRTRESMYNQPANMTLDALQEQLQNPFAPVRDDQRIHNTVTITRRGGSSAQVVDAASVDKHGTYDETATLNLFSDTQIADAAGWRLHQGVVPGMRYPQLTTDLGAASEVIDDWLTVDVGARVHVTNLPPQHPDTTVRVIAEGYSEPISPVTWKPVMNCSPASVWDVGVLDGAWVPDDYLLRLESDGSELNAAITTTATSMVVLVTAGPAWVTGAGEFPFDLKVDGERITVTAIAAPSGSTQSFTVTRSVNGVVRAHAAGTPIALWFQPVLAR